MNDVIQSRFDMFTYIFEQMSRFFFFKFVLLILNIKLLDEIKQTLARSNFYTIQDQLEVVFEIAPHRHCICNKKGLQLY